MYTNPNVGTNLPPLIQMPTKRVTKKSFRCTCSRRKIKSSLGGSQRFRRNDLNDIAKLKIQRRGEVKASIVD
jgi:hypothetical protein